MSTRTEVLFSSTRTRTSQSDSTTPVLIRTGFQTLWMRSHGVYLLWELKVSDCRESGFLKHNLIDYLY